MLAIILLVFLFMMVMVMRYTHITSGGIEPGRKVFWIPEVRLFYCYQAGALLYFVIRGIEGAYGIFSAVSYWVVGGGVILALVYCITVWIIRPRLT